MKRRFLSVLLAGVLAVSMLAGCGGGSDDAAETTTETTDAAETEDAAEDADAADAAGTEAGGGLVGATTSLPRYPRLRP